MPDTTLQRSSPSGARPAPKNGSPRMTPSTRRSAAASSAEYEAAAAGRRDDWDAIGGRQLTHCCFCSTSFPRNLFRGSQRAFATDAAALAWPNVRSRTDFDRAFPAAGAALLLHPAHARRGSGPAGALHRALRRQRRRGGREIRGDSSRHHPRFRPLSASQPHSRSRNDAGGTGFPGRRRLQRLRRSAARLRIALQRDRGDRQHEAGPPQRRTQAPAAARRFGGSLAADPLQDRPGEAGKADDAEAEGE